MNRFSIVRILVVGFAMLFLAAGVSYAQTSNGAIAGAMTDKTGAGVPGATVTVSSEELGAKRSTTTDAVGTYRIEALIPGKYLVVVTAQGFAELKIANVEVRGSYPTTVNGVLEVASVAATITVEAGTSQELQTQSGEISLNIGRMEITNLPIFNLNPISLVLGQPGVQGVASRDDFTNGTSFSVNGTRPRANNFLIEGQDNNDNSINGQAFQPINPEAIGEVTVFLNSYSAEFGRGGGSVTNVIYRGGSNDFHGSAWEYHRNSALAAIPAEDKFVGVTRNPVDIENIFGFSFGGPIKKNKLFVFGSSQWDRERSTNNGSTLRLPTAAGVTTLLAAFPAGTNANVDFLIASLGGLRGDPANVPRTVDLGFGRGLVQSGRVQRSGIGEIANDRQWNVKVDWNATQSDTISARYVRDDSVLTPDLFNFPGSLPPFDSQQGGPSFSAGLTFIHSFSARAVNEFRFSYQRINFQFGPTPATAANPLISSPAFSITGTSFPTFGFPTGLAQGRGHTTWQYQDALSYTVGSHTIKGGVDITHLAVVDDIPFNDRGTISFQPGGTCGTVACTGLANYVDNFTGTSGLISKVFGSPRLQPFVTTYAPYVQDTWRLRPNFTVDLGVRYEYWGVVENILPFPAVDFGRLGMGVPGTFPSQFKSPQVPDRNNFAPRIGFAYTPRWGRWLFGQDKTVIRAGYGIFYDGLFTNILDNTGAASPNAVGGTIVGLLSSNGGRGTANATGQLVAVAPVLNPLARITTIDSHLVNPLTHQWNLDIQHEIPGGFVITAAYVGTRGERLFLSQNINPRVNFGARINSSIGEVRIRNNSGDSIYHSAQLKVDHKFSHGFVLRGSYTFSKLIDTGSEIFETTSPITGGRFAQDPFCQECDRGLSAFHRKHRLALSYIWELPYVHSKDNAGLAILRAITRDWQISGTTTFQTGAPGTVNTGVDVNGDGLFGNDRPNLADPTKSPFDPARYSTPPMGTLGNVGRTTVLAPGRQDWNFAVQRAFKMPFKHLEQQQLLFRGEFFNVFNHPNLGIPDLNLSDTGDFGNLPETIFGGRIIRLYVKWSF